MHGSRRIASRPGALDALDIRVLRRAVRRSPLENSRCALPGRVVPGRTLRIAWCTRQVALYAAGELAGLRHRPASAETLPHRISIRRNCTFPTPGAAKWMGPPLNDASGRLTKVSDRAISGPSSAPREPPKPDIQTRLRSQFSTSRLKLLSRRDGSFLATDALRGAMRFLGRRLRVVLR